VFPLQCWLHLAYNAVVAPWLAVQVVESIWFMSRYIYRFRFPSLLSRQSMESSSQNDYCHILCVVPRKQPTLEVLHWLGQMESKAVCHSCMSGRVGCSFGHRILEYVFPGVCRKSILVSILIPNAVKISDMNSSWSEIRTLLSRQSVSPVYPDVRSSRRVDWVLV
jgi:hypothetical protein